MANTKYFAVTNNNGLISQELSATTKSDAIREVKDAVADKSAIAWHDDNQTDLEDACDVSCEGLSYTDALELCEGAGAEFVWGEPSDDKWNIWSHTTE
jgi:hypothetical protein